MPKTTPSYRQRKGYDQAIVTLTDATTRERRDYWLGTYGSAESRECYHRLVAQWEAAREAGDAGFDLLIACAFNYEARATDLKGLGRIRILMARMNADLHMAETLKNTGKGNLFVIFGEPDITLLDGGEDGGPEQIRVKVNGVDVFRPQSGEVVSDSADGIVCWFTDTDYNEESFFVRQAYFLGATIRIRVSIRR